MHPRRWRPFFDSARKKIQYPTPFSSSSSWSIQFFEDDAQRPRWFSEITLESEHKSRYLRIDSDSLSFRQYRAFANFTDAIDISPPLLRFFLFSEKNGNFARRLLDDCLLNCRSGFRFFFLFFLLLFFFGGDWTFVSWNSRLSVQMKEDGGLCR